MSKLTKFFLKLLLVGVSLFLATFTVYFFNLDMKLTSLIEPFLLKHYDNMPRKHYL